MGQVYRLPRGARLRSRQVVGGIGMPIISSIYECAQAARPYGVPNIADGGIRHYAVTQD